MDEPELRESVLSIRNILHVLDNWNQGGRKRFNQSFMGWFY